MGAGEVRNTMLTSVGGGEWRQQRWNEPSPHKLGHGPAAPPSDGDGRDRSGTTAAGPQMPEEEKGGGGRQQRQPTARALPLELGSVPDLGGGGGPKGGGDRPGRSVGHKRRPRERPQVAAARRRGRTETSARARAGAAAAGRGCGGGPQGRRRPAGRAAETPGTAAGAGSCGGCVRGGRGLDSAWARAGKLQDAAAAALRAAWGGGDRRRGTPRGRGDVDKVP
ncbi:uncharacterized protein LOC109704932 [Ananas comosus]|uniref:Uncharacterized protein LOC109704932 n=1 Tax=Ananas comosus TaxID=4615 RepID=A0A6P5EDG8_ANACO|nr:uncharacterized protein LOC109704932 [Ananas comosus]